MTSKGTFKPVSLRSDVHETPTTPDSKSTVAVVFRTGDSSNEPLIEKIAGLNEDDSRSRSSSGFSSSSGKRYHRDTERSDFIHLGEDAGKIASDLIEGGRCTCCKCDFSPKIHLIWCFLSVLVVCLTLVAALVLVGVHHPEYWNQVQFVPCRGTVPMDLEFKIPKGAYITNITCKSSQRKVLTGFKSDVDVVEHLHETAGDPPFPPSGKVEPTADDVIVMFDYLYRVGSNIYIVSGGARIPGFTREETNSMSLYSVMLANTTFTSPGQSKCYEELRMTRGGSYDHYYPRALLETVSAYIGYRCGDASLLH